MAAHLPPSSKALARHWRQARRLLHEVFGLAALRPAQRTVLEAVFAGRDVLAIMPAATRASSCNC